MMEESFFWESSYKDPVDSAVFFSKKFSLFTRGDKVVVGVSGGKDSVFLSYVLSQYSSKFGISEISIAHFNHRTRGKESDRDEGFVRDFAEKLGVRCVIGKAERTLKSENEMREERYRFLVETARNLGANKLATAHTLDDQFETFILNLIRGKGFFSVIGIAPHTKIMEFPVVRPLLSTQKRHILDFLKKRNINYVEDSSNYDLSYLRNKIRAFFELLPDEIYNSILKGFFRFWLSSYQVVEFLGKIYDESPEKLPELIKTQIQLFREKGDYSFEEIKTLIKRK